MSFQQEMSKSLENIVEAIIFASEYPVKKEEIAEVIQKMADSESFSPGDIPVDSILNALCSKYNNDEYPFEVRKIGGGYQFFTKPDYHPYIKQAVLTKNQKKLSKAAMEVLSVIAYKQPVTKTEVEHIRGVNSDYAVHKLLDKKLITVAGRSEAPGKPLLYSTTGFFLQYLGLNKIEDMPKLKEFETTAEESAENFHFQNNLNN